MYVFIAMNPTGKIKTCTVRGTLRLTDISPLSMGVEFVKKIIDTLEQKIGDSLKVGETLYTDVTRMRRLDCGEKNGHYIEVGRGRSGVGQYECLCTRRPLEVLSSSSWL